MAIQPIHRGLRLGNPQSGLVGWGTNPLPVPIPPEPELPEAGLVIQLLGGEGMFSDLAGTVPAVPTGPLRHWTNQAGAPNWTPDDPVHVLADVSSLGPHLTMHIGPDFWFAAGAPAVLLGQAWTVALVMESHAIPGTIDQYAFWHGTSPDAWYLWAISGLFVVNPNTTQSAQGGAWDGAPLIWTVRRTAAPLISMRRNGSAVVVGNPTVVLPNAAGQWWVGSASSPFADPVDVSAILAWDRAVTDQEMEDIDGWLNDRYGVY